jgi:predicted DNA-binding protein (MmcQ/YjbR family)
VAARSRRPKNRHRRSPIDELRAFSLGYPGAHIKSPWPGHLDVAVRDKTFAYLSAPGEPMSVSCKLPHTAMTALLLSFVSPTAYGLGKSGWVTATFADGDEVPVALLKEWIDESYRAQAPKKLAAELGRGGGATPVAPRRPGRRRRARSSAR